MSQVSEIRSANDLLHTAAFLPHVGFTNPSMLLNMYAKYVENDSFSYI